MPVIQNKVIRLKGSQFGDVSRSFKYPKRHIFGAHIGHWINHQTSAGICFPPRIHVSDHSVTIQAHMCGTGRTYDSEIHLTIELEDRLELARMSDLATRRWRMKERGGAS
jgi:hypothetical protein